MSSIQEKSPYREKKINAKTLFWGSKKTHIKWHRDGQITRAYRTKIKEVR